MSYVITVEATQKVEDIYGKSYFPRRYHYLKDAKITASNLRGLGAIPTITDKNGKEKKFNEHNN